MNEQEEKSLRLAWLMQWAVCWKGRLWGDPRPILKHGKRQTSGNLYPYENLAQFAAILLKFPDVLAEMCSYDDVDSVVRLKSRWNGIRPTQANILDEILRMNGFTQEG